MIKYSEPYPFSVAFCVTYILVQGMAVADPDFWGS